MSEDESMYMSETSHGTGQAALQMQQRMLRVSVCNSADSGKI